MAQNLPHLPDWEQVSTNVIRILGGNPSKFTLQGTNTYLLGSGPSRILIDTAAGEKKWIDTVRTVLNSPARQPLTISTCLLTHWHHDHLGGVRDLEQLSQELNPSHELKVYKNQPLWNPDGLIDPSRVLDIHDGQKFSIDGNFEIQAIHTPGHAKDHMVFQITSSPDSSEVGAIFTADNVLGHGTAVFEDLQLYLDSLNVMKKRVVDVIALQQQDSERQGGTSGGPNSSSPAAAAAGAHTAGPSTSSTAKKRAYPGHGQLIDDAVSKFDEYIAHRRMREEEALNVLKYGTVKAPQSDTPFVADSITTTGESDTSDTESTLTAAKEVVGGKEWTSLEMVKVIYRHYPESLWEPAERGLLMVLEKLRRDGKVVNVGVQEDGKGRWRISEKAIL